MKEDFVRSGQGIQRYNLFLNVDAVFFCEGSILAPEEAELGTTPDVNFWNQIIRARVFSGTFAVVACGPKSQVIARLKSAMDQKLESNDESSVNTVYGCIDRDYDQMADIEGKPIRGLITTEGYSFENDLLRLVGTHDLIASLMPRSSPKRRESIGTKLREVDRFLGFVALIDKSFREKSLPFLPPDGIPSFISNLKVFDEDFRAIMFAEYKSFRSIKLKQSGCTRFGDVSKRTRINTCDMSYEKHGFYVCPGKTILKIIAYFLNVFGRAGNKWTSVGIDRLVDAMIHSLQSDPVRIAGLLTGTIGSWASNSAKEYGV